MKKTFISTVVFLFLLFNLSGCSAIGNKDYDMAIIYGATTLLSIFLLIAYCCGMKNKCPWYYLLLSSICVVNAGYLALSVSTVVEEALLANRIAYLGSAFLPLAMLMIIWRVCNFKIKKYLIAPLLCITTFAFGIAATPGYSDIYYKSVELISIDGMTVLEKEYGPLHSLYMYYLFFYFALMIISIVFASYKKKLRTKAYATILLFAVLVNICVWLMEQLVSIEFEFLSVSYIVCGLFLICLEFMLQSISLENLSSETGTNIEPTPNNTPNYNNVPTSPTSVISENTMDIDENERLQLEHFKSQLSTLTPTEKTIYNYYLSGKSTKDIIDSLDIKESTLKYHNRNIYSKLGASSRKQLIEFARKIEVNQRGCRTK